MCRAHQAQLEVLKEVKTWVPSVSPNVAAVPVGSVLSEA